MALTIFNLLVGTLCLGMGIWGIVDRSTKSTNFTVPIFLIVLGILNYAVAVANMLTSN